MTTEDRCETCCHFKRHTRVDREVGGEVNLPTGDCRRRSPRARLSPNGRDVLPGVWPLVRRDDGCGEWRSAA